MEFIDDKVENVKNSPDDLWYMVFSGLINIT